MTTLFVAKLSFDTTNASLEALFAEFGTVQSARVVTDRETSKSKGFAFVEFENDSEALNAIKALDGKEFEGREIAVTTARPREDRSGGGNRPHQSGGGFKRGFQNR